MGARTWNLIRKTFPVSIWVIVVAVAFGLCHGSFYLDESLDLATAIGIVGFVSISLGPWLAVNLHRLLMRGYAAWIAAISHRIEAIALRTQISVEPTEQLLDRPVRSTVVAHAVGYSCFATAFLFGAFWTGLLMTILTAQIGDYDYGHYVFVTAVALFVSVGTLAAQCSYFLLIHRKVGVIERELSSAGTISVNSAPVAVRAKVIGKSIARTEQLGARFVSIRMSSSEHAKV
jgi:hypothetical protein